MSSYKRLIAHVKKTLQTAEDNGMSINSDIERLKWELDVLDRADEVFKDYYIDNVFDLVLGKEAPEEEPFEDYAKCRTFDSNVISVGDELVYGCSNSKCVVLKIGVETFVAITDDGSICSEPKDKMWKRTGRNFPAIEHIINLIKKEKKDA